MRSAMEMTQSSTLLFKPCVIIVTPPADAAGGAKSRAKANVATRIAGAADFEMHASGLIVRGYFPPSKKSRLRRECCSRKDFLDDISCYIGQAKIPALETIGQFGVVEAKEVKDGGMEIIHVHRVFDGVPAKIVRFAEDLPSLYSPPRHPNAVSEGMMIAPSDTRKCSPVLTERRAAELGCPHHQCRVQQSTLLQVSKQGSNRLIHNLAIKLQVRIQVIVMIPRSVMDPHKANATLHHPAREQTIPGKTFKRIRSTAPFRLQPAGVRSTP